eukprot:TRINITY_DN26940_c0_g2_i1.p1 TRINITY_DN26940_c0_g2~~TRINITY_DN26940_c0_g2_i1.p1  ORF type:complete len:670 (-),score=96.16 TRINITY_DN26940_c0_g2_i1:104-2113(-)
MQALNAKQRRKLARAAKFGHDLDESFSVASKESAPAEATEEARSSDRVTPAATTSRPSEAEEAARRTRQATRTSAQRAEISKLDRRTAQTAADRAAYEVADRIRWEAACATNAAHPHAAQFQARAMDDDEECRALVEKAARRAAKKTLSEAAESLALVDDIDQVVGVIADAAASKAYRHRTLPVSVTSAKVDGKASNGSTHEGPPQKRRRDEPDSCSYRVAHEIVVNQSCPLPLETFEAAATSLGPGLVQKLIDQRYSAPTPIQAQAWPILLGGQDMVAVAKTGSGKTCGFLLPALTHFSDQRATLAAEALAKPSVLILAPTRELAQQIAEEADKYAPIVRARVVPVYGGAPKGQQIRALQDGTDILIATPGRLLDFASTAHISLDFVTYLVLDEADKMLDLGFERDIRQIVGMCPKTIGKQQRQTLFFTATWPQTVQSVAASLTRTDAIQVRIGQGEAGDRLTANQSVAQEVWVCERKDKINKLKEYLNSNFGSNDSAIVFVGTKECCNFVEMELTTRFQERAGLWCRALHGDKEQWEREETLEQFRNLAKTSKSGILVATDVAARGLDIPGVTLVVVYDFGKASRADMEIGRHTGIENYIHRIGRTGRGGKKGRSFTLYTEEDTGAKELVKLLQESMQTVSADLLERAGTEKPQKKKRRNHGFAKHW